MQLTQPVVQATLDIPAGSYIWLQVWNSSATATFLQVRYVVILPDGTFKKGEKQLNTVVNQDFTHDRAQNTIQIPLPEGKLVSLDINYGNGNVKYGQTWVSVHIAGYADDVIIRHLGSDYVFAGHNWAYPKQQEAYPMFPQRGDVLAAPPGDPAIGAFVSVVVPDNATWLIEEISLELECTGSNGTSRVPFFYIIDPAQPGVYYRKILSSFSSEDGADDFYHFIAGIGSPYQAAQAVAGVVPPEYYVPFPDGIILPAGWTFGVGVISMHPDDQIITVLYSGKQWIQP